jgi:NTE family protein
MAEFGAALASATIFQGLSDQEFDYVRQQIVSHPFSAGDTLLETGRDAPGIFVIASGVVSAVVADDSGHEREVASLGQGECVGEIALMTGEPCSATVRAITAGEAYLLSRDAFLELVERYPGLWRNVGRILSQRLVRTSRHLSRPHLANTVTLLMDSAEDETAVLAIAVAHSLARQSGKRVLLVDARAGTAFPAAELARELAGPSLAQVLRDRPLLTQLEPKSGNGAIADVRVTMVSGEGEALLSDDECMAALETVTPLFDFILLVQRHDVQALHSLMGRGRSALALITKSGTPDVPGWVAELLDSPSLRPRLEVAMLTGDRRASYVLEEIESRLGKAVVRLPVTAVTLRQLADAGSVASGQEIPQVARQVIDRLARQIGEIEVGLALGAGAAKGFAHIGVLKVLEQQHVPIDYLAGCSIGAIVGAMYAGGLPFEEIEARMQGADRKVRRWHLPLRSVWSDAGLKEILRTPYPTARFRELQTPFAVVATDVGTGREIVIRKGIIWRAVQASTSVPGIFPPTLIAKRQLVDGGLVNPVPSQTVRDLGADFVIAVDLMSPSARAHHISGPARNSQPRARVPNLVEMLWRATEIMQEEVTLRSAATADLTIEPKLGRVRWSDFSHRGREFIALGEQAASEKMSELQRLIPGVIGV